MSERIIRLGGTVEFGGRRYFAQADRRRGPTGGHLVRVYSPGSTVPTLCEVARSRRFGTGVLLAGVRRLFERTIEGERR